MLLLLLIAGLEYDLPISLMRATLETAKLSFIGYFLHSKIRYLAIV